MRYVPDTVILIDYLNAIPAAIKWLNEHHDDCVLTPITRAEVLAGCEAPMIDVTNRWLDTFAQCDIDHTVAKTAAALRQSLRVKLPDAIQAACASTLGLTFVTRNTKDFDKRKFPALLVPYRAISNELAARTNLVIRRA